MPVEKRLGFYFGWLARRLDVDINFQYMCRLLEKGADINATCGMTFHAFHLCCMLQASLLVLEATFLA